MQILPPRMRITCDPAAPAAAAARGPLRSHLSILSSLLLMFSLFRACARTRDRALYRRDRNGGGTRGEGPAQAPPTKSGLSAQTGSGAAAERSSEAAAPILA